MMTSDNKASNIEFRYGLLESQLSEVAELFDQGFSAKFKFAIRNRELRINFWRGVLNTEQILGAYVNENLAGIALLTFENKSGFLPSARKTLFKVLGLRKGLRAALYFVLFSKLDFKAKNPSAYIEAICVSKDFQGKGIGSSLISEISDLVSKQGITSLFLQVTLENNSARKLYERIGFKEISISKTPILHFFTKVSGAHLMEWNFSKSITEQAG